MVQNPSVRVLVLGGSGMLGSDLVAELADAHHVTAPTSSELDLTDPNSVAQIAAGALGEFDWCVNCAAYTQVDLAESEQEAAYALNALGPGYLGRACAFAGIKLLHLSTDFVFDGTAQTPYEEDAEPHPLGVYGRTKLDGESAAREADPGVVIFRTSWLFGIKGRSFPRTIVRAWEAEKPLKVVADQTGCPTYTTALAQTIRQAIERNIYPGIYHATGPDAMTWRDLAELTLQAWKAESGSPRPIDITPISTADWPTPASRPGYSVLSNRRLHEAGIAAMPSLQESLADFCDRLSREDER